MSSCDSTADGFDPAYLVTLDEIYHSHWAAAKKQRIALLVEALDHFWPGAHPTRLIHLTGTNGKGSTAHALMRGLALDGRSGGWVGPHLFDWAERIQIDGRSADHSEIVATYRNDLEPYQRGLVERCGLSLSFAELGILMALLLFDRHGVEWAVMEVGAGGRYTPLMALSVAACVLTDVADDHPKSLGEHLWQRALVKAGIARRGIPFITAATGDARSYVVATAGAEGAPVELVESEHLDEVGRLLGSGAPRHHLANLALAAATVRRLCPELVLEQLVAVMDERPEGRFWSPCEGVVVDVAHNVGKVAGLAESLRLEFGDRPMVFLLALTRSRSAAEVFAPLLKMAERIVFTTASYPGRDPRELAAEIDGLGIPVEIVEDPLEAYQRELERRRPEQLLVLAGSAYMIDQALNPNRFLRELNATYGWRTRE